MAGSVNKVILVGNVGKDPEIRSTQDGRKIANLRIATSESWKDKSSGEKREKTEWHSVVIFGPVAEVAERYVKKGSIAEIGNGAAVSPAEGDAVDCVRLWLFATHALTASSVILIPRRPILKDGSSPDATRS